MESQLLDSFSNVKSFRVINENIELFHTRISKAIGICDTALIINSFYI